MKKLLIFLITVMFTSYTIAIINTVNGTTKGRFMNNNIVSDFIPDGLDTVAPVGSNTGDPFIAYSDLTYGPSSGWSAVNTNKGAVVTIWGRNFGATRGTSYVTVNGTNLTAEISYVDDWAKTDFPTPFMQAVTFQLDSTVANGSGGIQITVDGNTSNTLPFTVGAGSIKFIAAGASSGAAATFVDPVNCDHVRPNLAPGDIYYYRGGTYTEECGGSGSNVIIYNGFDRASATHGTAALPMALVAYPGEVAILDTVNITAVTYAKCVSVINDYLTVAKFKMDCAESAMQVQGFYSRAVGNDIDALHVHRGGAGSIGSGNDGVQVFGNAIYGGASKNKLDHAIYFSGCTPVKGSEAGYNWIYANDFDQMTASLQGVGAWIVDNHQESRCESDEYMKATMIYNNLLDCTGYNARAIGIFDNSWTTGEAVQPEPALIYNNIIIRCGTDAALEFFGNPVAYHNDGHAVFFNNTFLDSYGGLSIVNEGDGGVLSTNLANNVFTALNTGGTCIGTETSANGSGVPIRIVNNNASTNCTLDGTNDVTTVTGMTYDRTAYNPVTVLGTSSLVDVGSNTNEVTVNSLTYPMVTRDFYGTPRTLGSYDIGAIEVIQ